MSIEQQTVYKLVDVILDKGLPFVASYLEKMISRSIIVTDNAGQMHYPKFSKSTAQFDNTLTKILPVINKQNYYYQESTRCLYFYIKCSKAGAFIIVKNISIDMVVETVSILIEARLTIKCYFSNLNKIKSSKDKFEKELAEYLFLNNNVQLKEIINQYEKNLDLSRPYFVEIMEITGSDKDVDLEQIRSYAEEYLKMIKFDAIPIIHSKYLTIIAPTGFRSNISDINRQLPMQNSIHQFKELCENKFDIVTSIGIGQAYQLIDLRKSYYEALIALTLSRLMGKENFVRQFNDLGVYCLIFSQDISLVRSYCYKALGPLIENNDEAKDGLLSTLRKLLDSNVNWRATAESLFIHVNTLHYRVEKIEKLLKVDLFTMDTRSNLYSAIKVWDTLNINGF
jgi:sugar diacid utilization regulator